VSYTYGSTAEPAAPVTALDSHAEHRAARVQGAVALLLSLFFSCCSFSSLRPVESLLSTAHWLYRVRSTLHARFVTWLAIKVIEADVSPYARCGKDAGPGLIVRGSISPGPRNQKSPMNHDQRLQQTKHNLRFLTDHPPDDTSLGSEHSRTGTLGGYPRKWKR